MFTWLLEMVLPATCLSCSKPVASPGLCDSCWINSGLIAPPYCTACGRPQPFELADEVCTSCSVQPPHLDKIRAVCRYTDISRKLIIGLKHAGKIHRVPLLSQMMAHAASDMILHENTSPMMVIPVPLHWRRYLHRGFNQSAELARNICRHYPGQLEFLPNLLLRTQHTSSLAGKSKAQRIKTVAAAFSLHPSPPEGWQKRPVLLVDDVMTTGATLNICADFLRQSGHRSTIYGLVFARVMPSS